MHEASAPAKIILLGEHAVVYDQPAIAVPLSGLRASARFIGQNVPGHGLQIISEDTKQTTLIASDGSTDEPLANVVNVMLGLLGVPVPDAIISIQSDIPLASGLGSGAAISAALGRTLSSILNLSIDNQRLNEIVYQTEKIHHGTPSGIDNTVVVYEQPVYFRRNSPIEHLTIQHPFHLLIANTGEQSLTRIAVGEVRRLYESKSQQIQGILDAIGQLVSQARQAMEQGNSIELGQLMSKNHTLLQQLTVSSTELDTLVKAALDNGALGAKLSGGGRGGNMIALVAPDDVSTVETALYDAGATHVYATVVGSS